MVTAWPDGKSKPQLRRAARMRSQAFFHGDVRQSDDREMALESRDDVHFGFDEIGVNAEHGCAECLKEHPKMP